MIGSENIFTVTTALRIPTFSIMILSILGLVMTICIMTLSIMGLVMALSIRTLSIMTLSIMGLVMTPSINDIQHNDTQHSGASYDIQHK